MEDLYKKNGRYWYWKGMSLPAMLAWAIGFAIYLGFSPMLMEKVLGMKVAFPWAIGSSFPSMILAGLIFWLVKSQYERMRVRQQNRLFENSKSFRKF